MSIPNGIQDHILWTMDGRTWIENVHASGKESKALQRALDRGWARLVPAEAVRELVAKTQSPNH